MHVLRERDVHREKQYDCEVHPPEQAMQYAGGGLTYAPVNEQATQRPADDDVGLRAGAALRNIEAVYQQC